jgi:hypothetical protein
MILIEGWQSMLTMSNGGNLKPGDSGRVAAGGSLPDLVMAGVG